MGTRQVIINITDEPDEWGAYGLFKLDGEPSGFGLSAMLADECTIPLPGPNPEVLVPAAVTQTDLGVLARATAPEWNDDGTSFTAWVQVTVEPFSNPLYPWRLRRPNGESFALLDAQHLAEFWAITPPPRPEPPVVDPLGIGLTRAECDWYVSHADDGEGARWGDSVSKIGRALLAAGYTPREGE